MTLLNFTPLMEVPPPLGDPLSVTSKGSWLSSCSKGSEDLFKVHLVSEEAYLHPHPVARQVPHAPFIDRDFFIFCHPL